MCRDGSHSQEKGSCTDLQGWIHHLRPGATFAPTGKRGNSPSPCLWERGQRVRQAGSDWTRFLVREHLLCPLYCWPWVASINHHGTKVLAQKKLSISIPVPSCPSHVLLSSCSPERMWIQMFRENPGPGPQRRQEYLCLVLGLKPVWKCPGS